MLRILLIILVALAVIIGLMRLTGAKPGDAAPAGPVEEAVGAAIEADPAADVVIEEPAVDTLDAPIDIVEEPAPEALEITPDEAALAPAEISADPAPAEPENAAPDTATTNAEAAPVEDPAADPAPVPETPQR
jgi:translation initiation factor IF-2